MDYGFLNLGNLNLLISVVGSEECHCETFERPLRKFHEYTLGYMNYNGRRNFLGSVQLEYQSGQGNNGVLGGVFGQARGGM